MSTLATRLRQTEFPRVRKPRPKNGAGLLVPVGAVGVAAGVAADTNPIMGAGLAGLVLLTFLPWTGLFAALVGTSIANRAGYVVSGLTLRVAEAVLVPFAFRAFFFTNPSLRPRWRLTEWLLIMWITLSFISSYFNAVSTKASFIAAGVETFGVITYLATYTSVCSPARVKKAVRIFLVSGAIGAFIGILSLVGYYGGLKFGVDFRFRPLVGGAPSIKGLAYEHDIFGSTCAAVAMALFVLLREQSTLFTRKWTLRLLWISLIGMFLGQGRGAWLGFFFVFGLYWVFKRRKVVAIPRLARTAVVLILFSLLGVGGFFLSTSQSENATPSVINGVFITSADKFANILNTNSGTGAGRLRLWTKGTTEVMATSPLVGLGTYSYGQRNFRPSPYTAPYLVPGYLISLWVRTLYDTGILGTVLLALFMLLAFWPRPELQTSKGDLAVVARAMSFASVVLAASYLITDSTLLVWPWILFGLTRATISQAVRQARQMQRLQPVPVEVESTNGSGPPGA
jgi:O-antigen ligase/polysaccharide polymerase Wzy-like membrane protein